jgi:hypothetical protein
MWKIENENFEVGGEIYWEDKIRLRSQRTGLYMAIHNITNNNQYHRKAL